MVSINRYLLRSFLYSFWVVFIPFFLIISLIYLIKISSLSSQVALNFPEMLKLFGYSIPDILFYTIPASFISALASTFARLSNDHELISLFALGVSSFRIIATLIPLALSISALLFALAFVGMPISKQLYGLYVKTKQQNASLQIEPKKLGQQFGNGFIYISDKEDNRFKEVVIFSKDSRNQEQFFASKYGVLHENNGTVSFELIDGYGYTYATHTLQEVKFDSLEVFAPPPKDSLKNFQSPRQYWSPLPHNPWIQKTAIFYAFVSLIPLLGFFYIAAFTITNPRHNKAHPFLAATFVVFGFYAIATYLQKQGTPFILIALICLLLGLGYGTFHRKVLRHF